MISQSESTRSSFEDSSYFAGDRDREEQRNVCMLEASDVCEELLGSKVNTLDLADDGICIQKRNQSNFCDGSDSGVDIATTTTINNVTLQRALSNNSGGYASSTCGGLDEPPNGFQGNVSCDSSMISYSSDMCELKTARASPGSALRPRTPNNTTNYECCSENGSESSSLAGQCQMTNGSRKSMSSVKKKVAMFEPHATPNSRTTREKDIHAATTPTSSTAGQFNNGSSSSSRTRPRISGITRTASLTRHNAAEASSLWQARDRARSREKCITAATSSNKSTPTMASRPSQARVKPHKPDTFPATFPSPPTTVHSTPGMQRLVQRTPSLSRARTPGTPSDDGRWPSTHNKRGMSATPDLASMKLRANMISMEAKMGSSVNPYGTLPRRRKQKSVEDLTGRSSRSSSTSRDPFSNPRMISSVILSSRRNLANSYGNTTKMLPPANITSLSTATSTLSRTSSLARSKKALAVPKTRIYHEIGAQTAITGLDLGKIMTGTAPLLVAVDAVEFCDAHTQSDIRDRELERLHDEIHRMRQREGELATKVSENAQRATQLEMQLKKEREEKLVIQRELHLNTERVMGMLELARVSGTPNEDDDVRCDSLLMLESQIQMSGHELHEKQQEITKLRQLCRTLQAEMERSLLMQDSLLQEKVAIEQESNELHDFLQHEKAAMCDALKEMEQEYHSCKRLLITKDEEIKVLRDECRHLVRLNEQRRQENRTLQSKYVALEHKSKDLIAQQNTSVSGASMSLSGLHSRLDSLVEQLVMSYNISEQDLEDIVYQTENSANSSNINDGTACENATAQSSAAAKLFVDNSYPQTSDGSLSPQRNQSFIAAVISAIRHATTPSGKKLLSRSKKSHPQQEAVTTNGDSDSTTEMLDSETEPCLMMDNVLEDVTMPDSHSHNLVSTTKCLGIMAQKDGSSELGKATGDESLHNLSQAIKNRQQMDIKMNSLSIHKVPLHLNSQLDELNSVSEDAASCHDSLSDLPSLAEYCSAQTVVDQVIEVDTIVTKLLKVLRLIQMDNDNCIQQLIMDKNKLQQNKEDMLEKLKDLQDVNAKLQDDLVDATQELMLKKNDLSSSKAEMQRHRNEIDRLTQDICNLSILCSNYKKLSPSKELQPTLQSDCSGIVYGAEDNNGILNLLKMWQQEGQLQKSDVQRYLLNVLMQTRKECECEYNANRPRECPVQKLHQTLKELQNLYLQHQHPALQDLRQHLEDIMVNTYCWNVQPAREMVDKAVMFDNLNANDTTMVHNTLAQPTSL